MRLYGDYKPGLVLFLCIFQGVSGTAPFCTGQGKADDERAVVHHPPVARVITGCPGLKPELDQLPEPFLLHDRFHRALRIARLVDELRRNDHDKSRSRLLREPQQGEGVDTDRAPEIEGRRRRSERPDETSEQRGVVIRLPMPGIPRARNGHFSRFHSGPVSSNVICPRLLRSGLLMPEAVRQPRPVRRHRDFGA